MPLGSFMVDTKGEDGLEDLYRAQIASIVDEEAKKRIEMYSDPEEDQRLLSLDIIETLRSSSQDAVPALMARLGAVRAALEGHGGALVIHDLVSRSTKRGMKPCHL